jgi:hypothetical protein
MINKIRHKNVIKVAEQLKINIKDATWKKIWNNIYFNSKIIIPKSITQNITNPIKNNPYFLENILTSFK